MTNAELISEACLSVDNYQMLSSHYHSKVGENEWHQRHGDANAHVIAFYLMHAIRCDDELDWAWTKVGLLRQH